MGFTSAFFFFSVGEEVHHEAPLLSLDAVEFGADRLTRHFFSRRPLGLCLLCADLSLFPEEEVSLSPAKEIFYRSDLAI